MPSNVLVWTLALLLLLAAVTNAKFYTEKDIERIAKKKYPSPQEIQVLFRHRNGQNPNAHLELDCPDAEELANIKKKKYKSQQEIRIVQEC